MKQVLSDYSKDNNIPVRTIARVKFIDQFYGPHSGNDLSINSLKEAIDLATDEYKLCAMLDILTIIYAVTALITTLERRS